MALQKRSQVILPDQLQPIVSVFDNKHKSYLYLKGLLWGLPPEARLSSVIRESLGSIKIMLGWQLTWLQEHLIYEHVRTFPSGGMRAIENALTKLGVRVGDRFIPPGNADLYDQLQALYAKSGRNIDQYHRLCLPVIMQVDYLKLKK